MRPLVTIDDPVTIIEPHRVLLEWVDQVYRDGFHVRSVTGGGAPSVIGLPGHRHDSEGTTWARGHHLPDSEVVVALRAAASLVVQEKEKPKVDYVAKSLSEIFGDMPAPTPFAETRRLWEDARRVAKDAEKTARPPWTSRWMPWLKR